MPTSFTTDQLRHDFRNVWVCLKDGWKLLLLCEPKDEAHEVASKLSMMMFKNAPVLVLSAMEPAPYRSL